MYCQTERSLASDEDGERRKEDGGRMRKRVEGEQSRKTGNEEEGRWRRTGREEILKE